MAKKKKGRQDARGYGQGPSTKPASKPASAPTITSTNVSSRTHYTLVDLVELLQQQEEKETCDAPAIAGDRFVKKLTLIHDRLEELGFDFETIQRVVVALGYGITLELALDWLCWHLPTQDLPSILTEGAVRDTEEPNAPAASLTVIAPTKSADGATTANELTIHDDDEADDFLSMIQPLELSEEPEMMQDDTELKESASLQADEKARILAQYQYEQEDDEHEHEVNVTEAASSPPAEAEMSPDRLLLLQLEEKLRHDEADLKDEAANYMRSKYEIKDMQKQVQQLRKQIEGLRRTVKRQEAAAVQKKQEQSSLENDDNTGTAAGVNEEDGLFSMFDEDEAAAPATSVEEVADVAETVTYIVPDDSIPAKWTGKTPKVILDEWCRKQKVGVPRYDKLPRDGCRIRVSIKPSPVVIEQEGPLARKIADAREYVAAKALYHINPTLPLYRLFPPFYRDLWLSWIQEVQGQKEADLQTLQDAKKAKIELLIQSIPKQKTKLAQKNVDTCEPVEDETEPVVLDSWDDAEGAALENDSREMKPHWTVAGERLKKEFLELQATRGYQSMLQDRSLLPIFAYRDETLNTIRDHPVTILCAETGAGKTTQVGQFLLEEAFLAGRGDGVSIICTQPRRVAATSVAERVAEEMCEPALGKTIGYQIRLEAKRSSHTKLLFCTTGVVLRRLQDDPELKGVTHVLVDEVHERQYQIDVLLVTLRQLLVGARPDLKVILMSATLDAELFCSFFNGAPLVSVPGRTFPVASYYLEDLIEATDHTIEEGSNYAIRDARNRERNSSLWVTTRGGEKRREAVSLDSELYSAEVSDEFSGYKMSTRRTMDRVNEEIINFDLLEDILGLILVEPEKNSLLLPPEGATFSGGSVLVFLPGLGEIRAMTERLGASRTLSNRQRFDIIPMHSTLSPSEQRRAFLKPKKGLWKIILSTNICETSVTIPDVVCVIDTGRVREVRQNKRTSTSTLVTDWCSRASAKQRSGRAGRVQPGVCLKLFSSRTANYVMKKASEPELQRVPLQEVCLSILAGGFASSCMDFLCQAPQPPTEEAVQSALTTLNEVGAIALVENASGKSTEHLTPLGHHLSKLPVDVRLGKMLIFGALFHCLDPILTVAASLSCQSPFATSVRNAQEAAAKHKQWHHPQSDFLTIYNVWEDYRKVASEGASQSRKFCTINYLNRSALQEVGDMREHFLSLLKSIGFLDKYNAQSRRNGNRDNEALRSSLYNANGQNIDAVHAVICAGLYPHVAHLVATPGGERSLWYNTERLHFHSSSVNSKLPPTFRAKSSWIAFHEKFGTQNRVSVSTTCFVHPFALLIFGRSVVVKHLERKVVVDDWIELGIAAQTGVMFRELRKQVDALLKSMISISKKPRDDSSEKKAAIMIDGIINLLSSESVSF